MTPVVVGFYEVRLVGGLDGVPQKGGRMSHVVFHAFLHVDDVFLCFSANLGVAMLVVLAIEDDAVIDLEDKSFTLVT